VSDPDGNANPEARTDPRHDAWPVGGGEAYADWPVERATPGDDDAAEAIAEEYAENSDMEWLGFTGGGRVGSAYLYAPAESTIYEGEINEENKRVILREHSRREVESEDSLGEHIRAIGEEHGWSWLATFGREHLEDDERPEWASTLELQNTDFTERNVLNDASYDLSFTGTHTLVDASGRVHIIDRQFNVHLDGRDGGDGPAVEVDEDYLFAEEPRSADRAGDAELIDQDQFDLDLHVDTDEIGAESNVKETLQKWHQNHREWAPQTT